MGGGGGGGAGEEGIPYLPSQGGSWTSVLYKEELKCPVLWH